MIRSFIAIAREYRPYIPEELTEWLSVLYADIRNEEVLINNPISYTTPRTLLSIIRMSQALARLRFQDKVSRKDVEEALRLMRTSKTSLMSKNSLNNHEKPNEMTDIFNKICNIISERCNSINETDRPIDIIIRHDELIQHLFHDHSS